MIKVSPRTKKTSFQVTLPEAESVKLVGDFNGWNAEANPMKKNKSGLWKTDLKLDAGEYQFRYLVNESEWLNDDATEVVPNSYGSTNSVANVAFPKPKRRPAAKKTASKNGRSKSSK